MFSAYNSIENHYRKSEIETVKLYLSGLHEQHMFVCSEKVHGSNFQVYIFEDGNESNGISIKLGKRKSMIKKEDKFFPHAVGKVMEKYEKKFIDIYHNVKKDYAEMNLLILYGELYGGFYPTEGRKLVHKPIQKHLYYCHHFDFYPFDVKIVTMEQMEEVTKKRGKYVSYDSFERYMEEVGWKIYGRKIFEGTFSECLEFDTRFSTKVADWHGMPARSDGGNNICEGVVIKPKGEALYIRSERVMIKKKNEEFSEIQKKPKKNKKKKPEGDGFTEEEREVYNKLLQYINIQRFESVISKEGDVSMKSFGKYMKLLAADALEEFEKDVNWKEILEEKSRKKLRKRMNTQLSRVIKQWFLVNDTENH